MVQLPNAQELFTSGTLWGLWKLLDSVYDKLRGHYGAPPAPDSTLDNTALLAALAQLQDEQSLLMQQLVKAWRMTQQGGIDTAQMEQLLSDLSREEGLVLLAIVFYSAQSGGSSA
jgi:hypothetical protein